MNSKDFIQALRKVIREEVQTAVRTELSQIGSVIRESKKPAPATSQRYTDTYKPKPKPKQQFSKNSMLNDILNETGGFRSENPYAMLQENYSEVNYNDFDEWPTMSMGQRPMAPINKAAMLPTTDTEGRPLNPNTVPEEVVNAITKDYSALMKAIDKKKGK
jgi:hypothetical protein